MRTDAFVSLPNLGALNHFVWKIDFVPLKTGVRNNMKIMKWFIRKLNIKHEHRWNRVGFDRLKGAANQPPVIYECELCGEQEYRTY